MNDADALRRQDVTCTECGARSRPGFEVPDGYHCEKENQFGEPVTHRHRWKPTEEVPT